MHRFKEIPISKLLLDHQNYRHDPTLNQLETLQELIDDQGQSL